MPHPIPILLLITLLFVSPSDLATDLVGKVVGVSDGDTITVLVDKKPIKIRLEGIDAPEAKQSFGNRSKQALSDLVFGKEVRVKKTGEDRYGRSLGFVSRDGIDINAKMIQDGWAWHYKKYNRDSKLADLELQARAAKRGLWTESSRLHLGTLEIAKSQNRRQAPAVSIGSTRIQTFGTMNHASISRRVKRVGRVDLMKAKHAGYVEGDFRLRVITQLLRDHIDQCCSCTSEPNALYVS